MRKILALTTIFWLAGGGFFCLFAQETLIELNSSTSLTLTVPGAVSYTLQNPLDRKDEVVASAQAVTLQGNLFTNAPTQPFITVSIQGQITNAALVITSITRQASLGNVTVNPSLPVEISLSAIAQGYAFPDKVQKNTAGLITCNHSLTVRKSDYVPGGVYNLIILWTGSDGSA